MCAFFAVVKLLVLTVVESVLPCQDVATVTEACPLNHRINSRHNGWRWWLRHQAWLLQRRALWDCQL